MSFFFSFFRLTIFLFNVIWVDTIVDVPVHSDINDYVDLPQAFLYEDGEIVENAVPYYRNNGVDRTFLSTVNTNYVKAYNIYYEVYFALYDITDKVQITFNVVDQTNPVISNLSEYTIDIGDKLPDFRNYLVFEDNYDSSDQLIIDINTTLVIESQIGSYPILYTIRDSSNNSQTYETLLHIIDRIPPSITLIKPIVIDVHTAIEKEKFLKIEDNYDLNLNIHIDDKNVDYHIIGNYEFTITAIDSSKNFNQKVYTVSIVDRISPTIILKSYPETINVFEEITDQLLRSYVLALEDNYDIIDIKQIHITHDIDTARVGKYKIYYQVRDSSLNEANISLEVEVVDQVKPNIEIIEPFIFEVFSEPSSLYNHFVMNDNYCSTDDLKTTITTNYKLDVIGKYDIKIEVVDTYKNKAVYMGIIEIIDSTPPEIIELSEIIITDFKEKDLSIYFRAIDGYDQSDLEIYVDDQLVIYDKIGDYEITVYAYDQSNNEAMTTSSVIIIDISAPTLILTHDFINLGIGEQKVDLYDYVLEIHDNYDTLDKNNLMIESSINYQIPGTYKVTYLIMDSSLNQTMKSLNVYINDYDKPNINADTMYINMYETVDLLEGLSISDNVGVLGIYFNPKVIDTSYPGTYKVTYIVIDESGNTNQLIREIHINEIEKPLKIEAFIPIIIVSILSVSVIYYLYKKI